MCMNSYQLYLNQVCEELTKQFGLDKKDQRVDIERKKGFDEILAWVVVDKNSNVLERYHILEDLMNSYRHETVH